MEHIIDSLLFLAKPDKKNLYKNLNITEKTQEIIEKYNTTNSILYIHDKKGIRKNINDELYKRILCNLIENAVKYKSDGDISINLSQNKLTISNNIHKNLSKVEEKNILKAFYQ
jgi:signal transduction histidine kinase